MHGAKTQKMRNACSILRISRWEEST